MASSTPYWMMGLSTSGSISLGWALVAGKNRVPRPAAGKTALRTFMVMAGSLLVRCWSFARSCQGPTIVNERVRSLAYRVDGRPFQARFECGLAEIKSQRFDLARKSLSARGHKDRGGPAHREFPTQITISPLRARRSCPEPSPDAGAGCLQW